jgi:hypothetical protein
MIYQIVIWTSLISSIANIVPRLGDTTDISDKVRGHLVATLCQTAITLWAALNLFFGLNTDSLHPFVISYYIYDIGHLLMNPYAKKDHLFIVHHAGTIGIILYAEVAQFHYNYFYNVIYVLLEGSGIMLNIAGISKSLSPYTKCSSMMSATNVATYGLTRILLYPLHLLHFLYVVLSANPSLFDICIRTPPAIALIALYIVSVRWYMVMIKRVKASLT